jgi:hypothetical protein
MGEIMKRVILASFVLAMLFLSVGCEATSDTFVGTWKKKGATDEALTFRKDGTCRGFGDYEGKWTYLRETKELNMTFTALLVVNVEMRCSVEWVGYGKNTMKLRVAGGKVFGLSADADPGQAKDSEVIMERTSE